MTRHAITVRVDYDTLTELHKLTANSKTNDFADVAGGLLDKAAAPNTYLVVVPPRIIEMYQQVAQNGGLSIEDLMDIALASFITVRFPISNSAWQWGEEAINLEQQ